MTTGNMQPHAIPSGTSMRAIWTLVPLLACMCVHVLLKIIGLDAGVRTEATLQGSLTTVNHEVLTQVVGVPRQQSALPTPKPHRRLTPLGRQHVLLLQRLSKRLVLLHNTNTEAQVQDQRQLILRTAHLFTCSIVDDAVFQL